MRSFPSASYSVTMRLSLRDRPGTFARVAAAVGKAGGSLGSVDLVSADGGHKIRDLSVLCADEQQSRRVISAVRRLAGVRIISASDRTFLAHLGGKIEVTPRSPVKTRDDLSMLYTPGVGRVAMALYEDPSRAWNLTAKGHMVAVVSDGSAVLGLGDIGPHAALPMLEAKAVLFKSFAGLDAFPLALDVRDPRELVETVVRLSPGFGAVDLEDIASPLSAEVEAALSKRLDIPVLQGGLHGMAVVVTAAALNSARLLGRSASSLRTVIAGAGAAAASVASLLRSAGVRDVVCCDRTGALFAGRVENMNPLKERLAQTTNPRRLRGDLAAALKGAHLFVGLSSPGSVSAAELRRMAKDALVFSLANPVPEVLPERVASFARVVATSRSDYPNQLDNALAFPGIFKGALAARATRVDGRMLLAAARAVSSLVSDSELSEDYVVPSLFNPKAADTVAAAVMRAAYETGAARPLDLPVEGRS
ncbi:MAG: NAD-dependent malic enzyme [Elusimicrobia bacterium]|nr:NAD-dependent malic enzyme [Elusimicrobiota bacterium]